MGFLARYIGPGARQFSISYNLVRFDNQIERQFVYSNLLLPLGRFLIVYGNSEFELGRHTEANDRLSRLFINARANLTKYADVTASYSSGRGMDYHQFLLEQSQDPDLQSSEIERFYYNKTYGVRLSSLSDEGSSASMFPAGRANSRTRASETIPPVSDSLSDDILHSGISLLRELQPESGRCLGG